MTPKYLPELPTPALIVDGPALERNLTTMAAALPGPKLRPHVKAHKCTELARRQLAHGHAAFACATVHEMFRMAAVGLGDDLLLANETLDAKRLKGMPGRFTLAVDSGPTVRAAIAADVREVLIDVNVGMPRCGCSAEDAGRLADLARSLGLTVRGVMGYEGHAVSMSDRAMRAETCEMSMKTLLAAHENVGGEIVSAGGTGTYALNRWATEVQAGSYALMDGSYAEFGLPFEEALSVLSTVISVSDDYAVADAGLKCFGMDHGDPRMDAGTIWFLSDEHTTFSGKPAPSVGDLVRIRPAHVDPTVAYHKRMYVVEGERVVDVWPVDMRGW